MNDTESTRNKDYDADKTLKISLPNLRKINKTIRETRNENRDEDEILRGLDLTFYPEKDDLKKCVSAFNNNYIQCESIGDKDKNLSVKEYINIIRPYLNDIINDRTTHGERRICSDNIITYYKSQRE